MTLYLIGGMIVISAALMAFAVWPKANDEGDTIKRRIRGQRTSNDVKTIREQARESVAKRMVDAVAPIAIRPSMTSDPEGMTKLRTKLAAAGFRAESAVTTFLASKTVVAVLLAAAAGAYAWMKGLTLANGTGATMFAGGLGFLAPELWLRSATSKRQLRIRHGLADTLDLLVITVESGLGLDAAFQRVGDEMRPVHPELAEELQLVTLESQMGIPRSEALSNMSTRTGIDEVKSLTAIINQAERFGTSIARALRNQSDAIRLKRKQAAEEQAQKTTVKLMAPLVMFIFPAILVVLAGPAALKMIEAMANNPSLN